ncbi:MMPL family transporter (plasmid) [Mycetohabitans endofungorum]|uniref:hopanoid transporter HpnN n=1 Tax=Mycetohabitans endofungorum TaxID=417203 RepID=UPI0030D09F0C
MLTSLLARIVRFSTRHAYFVIAVSILLCAASIVYIAKHFAIDTDVAGLIDQNTPWAQRGKAIDDAFPQRADVTLAVVQAPAAEFAQRAAAELAVRLKSETAYFSSVTRPDGGAFFERHGLLFMSQNELTELTGKLVDARPLLNRLAHDPSLRGLSSLLSVTLLTPLQTGQVTLPDMAKLLERSADTVDAVLAEQPAGLSWSELVAPDLPSRAFVQVQPLLDYRSLEAGAAAAARIKQVAAELQLAQRYGASVQLTGPRPLADEEFGSVREGAVPNAIGTLLTVLVILWFAVRSRRMVFAVFLTLLVGLAITAALGLMMVGALNMISVAFAVLFVGIGVDFGIQFAVRYREQFHLCGNLERALEGTAHSIAMPLSLAAAATAASFFSFLPTAYRGISELGQIAGVGILFVALPSCVTLLPALISVLRPTGRGAAPGFKSFAPLDEFTERHRNPLLLVTLALVVAGLPLLTQLRFDFNPLHLKDPNSESMRTLASLASASNTGVNDVQLLAASLDDAQQAANKLRALPEVGRVVTATSFVPDDQPQKLATIAQAARQLLPVLEQTPSDPAPDGARVSALRNAAAMLENAALDHPGPGAKEAEHLAASLRKLSAADAATRDRAERAIAEPLQLSLASLANLLKPTLTTLKTLPAELRSQWVTADGRALVQISPKLATSMNPDEDTKLRAFSAAVLAAEPQAIGGPISILHSADTIVRAFVQAGVLALVSITVLLWMALRSFGDVLRTLVPLLVSAVVTLELSVLLNLPLNFANIIALPLLLGVGVAFKIYYVMAWRAGATKLLQSGLTQAVILSAGTTATAFGSLWLSHHPGTSSMGELLALSLVCTLIGAVFFQPVLMGKPREQAARSTASRRAHDKQRADNAKSR